MIKPERECRDQHDAHMDGLMSPASVSAFTSGMKMMIVGTGSMKSPMTVNSSNQQQHDQMRIVAGDARRSSRR